MKRNTWLCLCLCLCVLLSACGTPVPEDSSAPKEESGETSSVSVIEDENAKTARAYLETLLTEEPLTEGGFVYWLTDERAETIRACVKQLKTPILTEEDALALAKRAAEVYFSAWQGRQSIILPACGALESVHSVTGAFSLYAEHEEAINALLAYTLYLFTPPNYVFWGSEIWTEGWYPSNMAAVDPAYALCLPFAPAAAEYATRQGALQTIREQQSCIRLYPLSVSDGARPLNFFQCGTPDLLRSGECTSLDLLELVRRGDVTPPEEFRPLYEEAYLMNLMWDTAVYASWLGTEGTHELPNGDEVAVYQLLPAEKVREIRERVEQLPAPILTRRYAKEMMLLMLDSNAIARNPLLLLPGIGGAEDVYLPQGVESLEDVLQMSDKDTTAKAYGAAAYLIDLFTPPQYRYTNLMGIDGTYYKLQNDPYYLLVTEKNELYMMDSMLNLVPLNFAA